MILNLLLIALAITLEPIPLTAFILVLASKNGVRKASGFIFGWLASLAIVISATLLATGNKPPKPNTAPSIAALVVKLVIGLALLFIAWRQRQKQGKPKPPKKTPKWQTGVDNMSFWFAMALGPLSQPWGLVAAGAAEIVEAKLSSTATYLALIGFCILSSGVYLAMLIYAAVQPKKSEALLGKLRHWLDTHTDQVIIWVSLVLGFWLIGTSIAALA